MSLRLRIALVFASLLALIGLLRVTGVLGGLNAAFEQLARTDAESRCQQLHNYLSDLSEERRTKKAPPLDLSSPEALIRAFSDDGMFVELLSRDGQVLNHSPNLGNQRFPALQGEGVRKVTVPVPHLFYDNRVLLISRRLVLPSIGWVGWIQIGYPLEDLTRMARRFAAMEIAGWAAATLLGLVVGYFFAGVALKPVAAMTAEVDRWTTQHAVRRFPTGARQRDELERLGETFNRLFDRLEASWESQRRFVADASHELKSPLTAMKGHLQLIARLTPELPELARKWLGTAVAELDRLSRLVNDILDLAQEHEASHRFQPVCLAELAARACAGYLERGEALRLAADSATGWVAGDPERLERVVINLVDNALRATQQGGEVVVGVRRSGVQLVLEVRDTGVGIAEPHLERVFDRFYRVDGGRSRDQGGSGLGLAIVKQIAEAHRGHVQVESRPGVGSTFRVALNEIAPPSDPLESPALASLSANDQGSVSERSAAEPSALRKSGPAGAMMEASAWNERSNP